MARVSGLTLIELLVALLVLSVLVGVGIPGFQTMVENNRVTSAANGLQGGLQYARSEAVRVSGFDLDANGEPMACLCPIAGDGDWEEGVAVFETNDCDDVDAADPDASLRTVEFPDSVAVGQAGGDPLPDEVCFNADGTTADAGAFELQVGDQVREVGLLFSGQSEVRNPDA